VTSHGWISIVVYLAVLTALAVPLGGYFARVLDGQPTLLDRVLGPVERLFLRVSGVRTGDEMDWKRYAIAVITFNALGALILYGLQRLQASLPLNPAALGPVTPEVSFNTAVSFASNTNWQAYGGETTMSHLVQMAGLGVQNFVSAATGIAVLVAVIRGFTRRETGNLGNFWVDLTRSTLYILLPLSLILTVVLVQQGVVQTFDASSSATLLEPLTDADGKAVIDQAIAVGPAASQVAIKQLGTNGGGFFNVNSAHPLENPTPISNFLEVISILLISGALCFSFGHLVKDRRQGWVLYGAMMAIFIPLVIACVALEQRGNPVLADLGADQVASALSAGGNMEGKEVRFGPVESAIWAVATTAASNGSVNAMHDSFTPLGGMIPMWLMQLGEIVFGGVGSGLYGMLMYAIVAVFIAGLLVGRTPEYLGKKIEAKEMKMASLVILLPAAAVLVGTAIACATEAGTSTLNNTGAHGFSEILYAFSSGANNNGSAFGGITVSGTFYATAIGICMWIGRWWVIVPALALAGSLARKKAIPVTSGTLPTHGPLFLVLVVGTIAMVGALTFIPALAVGPIVEHIQMSSR
jgi:K+-transporting ATPase ATPase A chain